jgi:hypothetical protein
MNAFKTVRRDIASNNASTVFSYKNKEANFNLAADFPSLSSSNSSNPTSSNATIDYSHTFTPTPDPILIHNANPPEPITTPPGWHKYSWNKSARIMAVDYGKGAKPATKPATNTTKPTNDEYIEGQHFIKMMARLEETQLSHAEQFIECYGYDCYEHTFLMAHYSPQYFSDGSDGNYSDGSNSNNEDDF